MSTADPMNNSNVDTAAKNALRMACIVSIGLYLLVSILSSIIHYSYIQWLQQALRPAQIANLVNRTQHYYLGFLMFELATTLFLVHAIVLLGAKEFWPRVLFVAVLTIYFARIDFAFQLTRFSFFSFWDASCLLMGFISLGWGIQRLMGVKITFLGRLESRASLCWIDLAAVLPFLFAIAISPRTTPLRVLRRSLTSPSEQLFYGVSGLTLLCIASFCMIYGWLAFIRGSWKFRIVAASLVIMAVLGAMPTEFRLTYTFPFRTLFAAELFVCFSLGTLLGYLPLHLFGFVPIWAEPRPVTEVEPISGDEIEEVWIV